MPIKLAWTNRNVLCPHYYVFKPGVHRTGVLMVFVFMLCHVRVVSGMCQQPVHTVGPSLHM